MRSYIIIIKIFVIAALLIISNNNLALKEKDNREHFFNLYKLWLSDFYSKASFIVGHVVKLEWLPETGSENQEDFENFENFGR